MLALTLQPVKKIRTSTHYTYNLTLFFYIGENVCSTKGGLRG